MEPRIGFIGFGEVAYYMMAGLHEEGLQSLHVYSRGMADEKARSGLLSKAASIGAGMAYDLHDLADQSDIIFSSVRGHVALETSKKMAEWIKPGQLYVDLNNAPPSVKVEGAAIITAKGARFIDVGLFGLPIQLAHKALMYACGEAAEEFRDLLSPYNMNIAVIPGEIGQAAKIKTLANIYMKCLQGVCLEFAISARSAGVKLEDLEYLLTIPVADIPKEKEAGFWIIRGALLAERKKEEMKDAFRMLEEMQVDPVMLKAAVERLERVSAFHLDRDFDPGVSYGEYQNIIQRMFEISEEIHVEVR